MKRPKLLLTILASILFILLLASPSPPADTRAQPLEGIELAEEEKAWLAAHPFPRIGVWTNSPPYSFPDSSGNPQGIVPDYIRAIEERIGSELEILSFASFSEAWNAALHNEIDVLPGVTPSERHQQEMSLTQPFHVVPVVLVTRIDFPLVTSLEDFVGRKIVVGKGHITEQWIARDFPEIGRIPTEDYERGLRLVSEGKADAYAGAMGILTWHIRKHRITNLKIAAKAPYEYNLTIAVRKDWPEMVTILNKALASIDQEMGDALYDKWVLVRFERSVDWGYVGRAIGSVVLLATVILLLIFQWNRRLQREIQEKERAEKALKESERKLSTLIGNLPGIAYRCLYDSDWTMLYLSDGCEALTGYRPAELIDNRTLAYNDLIVLDDREHVSREIQNAVNENRPFTVEYRILDKNKTEKWVWERGIAVQEEGDAPLLLEGFINDISERKRAETDLRNSEARLQAIFKYAPIAIALVDLEGRPLVSNPVFERMMGYRSGEMEGLSFKDFTHPDDLAREEPLYEALLEGRREWYQVEKRNVRSDGQEIWINTYIASIMDESNKPAYFVAIGENITDRKKAEEALRRSEHDLLEAQRITHIGSWVWDPAEDAVSWSEEMLKIFGMDATNSVTGLATVLDRIHRDDVDRVEHAIKESLEETGRYEAEFRVLLPSGEERFVHGVGTVDFDEKGEPLLMKGTGHDITDRVLAERERRALQAQLDQAQKMEAIGTLAGGIAHEFNNILSIVLGNTELALDDLPDWNPAHGFLLEAKQASLRGKDVTRQLLSFGRKSIQQKEPVRIGQIIQESIRFLRASIPANIRFSQNIAETSRPVLADQTQIHQLLINLCNNAAQAMEDGGGKLGIRLEDVSVPEREFFSDQILEPGEYVRLTVSDTGCGIPKDVLERVFHPFYTTKAVDEGSGLGLSVVHGIVKDTNGFIRIESEPAKGTTVCCYFPTTDAAPRKAVEAEETPLTGTETILFVDDEPSLVKMTHETLERLGYCVEAQTDPSEAFVRFLENPDGFDLVVTDMTMPQMTGDQLISRLKEIRPHIKTIICTGYSKKLSDKRAADLGADAFIMKPIDSETLARTVRQVLDRTEGPAPS